jgi:hypothetical protein
MLTIEGGMFSDKTRDGTLTGHTMTYLTFDTFIRLRMEVFQLMTNRVISPEAFGLITEQLDAFPDALT